MSTFDLTPDPKVLVALTRTPMAPLDALCELIDNAIDGFASAALNGSPIPDPTILITLPSPSDFNNDRVGKLKLIDNGPGMDAETAERALRAGYSGNNPIDSLGLFGMGFNISTGKLGRCTRLVTTRMTDTDALSVEIDLERVLQTRSFRVPFTRVPKRDGFARGTEIEISRWWPVGDANANFPQRLVAYGAPRLRAELGRRYSTLIRPSGDPRRPAVTLIVNREQVKPHEHCVWADSRFIERDRVGRIYAVDRFDTVLEETIRCSQCTAILAAGATGCTQCGGGSTRRVVERIRGWVGIQRFDDASNFGIDLIRNGRAIRVAEKDAFFEFRDDFNNVTKDYPIDGPYGRIVGEVHLDHVPVDFLKQDFQRTSTEWTKAIQFLRGTTSLQPSKWEEGAANKSPVSKLFQGYRRVRNYGRADMYMGTYDAVAGRSTRIARDKERELLEKFNARIPGFYDDAEWWKLVEVADQQPLPPLRTCSRCNSQNLEDSKACAACGLVLVGSACINRECGQLLVAGTEVCPHCERRQAVELLHPWRCNVCNASNTAEATDCNTCNSSKSAIDPLSREALRLDSDADEELSCVGFTVRLADGTTSMPIEVETRKMRRALAVNLLSRREDVPLWCYRELGRFEVYINTAHEAFVRYGLPPQAAIAFEIADFLVQQHSTLRQRFPTLHNLQQLAARILAHRWGAELSPSASDLRDTAAAFFESAYARLGIVAGQRFQELVQSLSETDQRELMSRVSRKYNMSQVGRVLQTPDCLRFIPETALGGLVGRFPSVILNSGLFRVDCQLAEGLPTEFAQQLAERQIRFIQSCLEDAAKLVAESEIPELERKRATLSLSILRSLLIEE
jgi:hypothetical protein